MKWLIIINNAVFASVYKSVAEKLLETGHQVVVATDCRLTYDKYELNNLQCDVYIFTDFEKYEQSENSTINHWLVHSDFDRNNYYNFLGHVGHDFWPTIAHKLWSFYESIFNSHRIDFVFYENISSGFSHVASELAQKYEAKYLGLTSSRLPGHVLFSGLDDDITERLTAIIEHTKVFDITDREYISNYIKNIVDTVPDYMRTNGLSSANFIPKVFKKRKFKNIALSLKYSLAREPYSFQMGNPLIKAIHSNLRELKRFITSRLIRKMYGNIPDDNSFYLYPLHYHPESSTSILAKYYDEYNLIKNISFSLPKNRFLVVKDHISAFGYEGFSFYKKICALPNVILINPHENSKILIQKSLGVFTLTSTVGYEAFILNKPVVIFGDVFYQNHPLVYKCPGYSTIKDGFSFIENNLKNYECVAYTEKFLLAYKKICYPMKLSYSGTEIQNNQQADDIVKLLHTVSLSSGENTW